MDFGIGINRAVVESLEAISFMEDYLIKKAEHKIKAKYAKKVAPVQENQ